MRSAGMLRNINDFNPCLYTPETQDWASSRLTTSRLTALGMWRERLAPAAGFGLLLASRGRAVLANFFFGASWSGPHAVCLERRGVEPASNSPITPSLPVDEPQDQQEHLVAK